MERSYTGCQQSNDHGGVLDLENPLQFYLRRSGRASLLDLKGLYIWILLRSADRLFSWNLFFPGKVINS